MSTLSKDALFVAEFAKAKVVNDISDMMNAQSINKSDMACLLGKSRQYVGQALSEHTNFTIERLAEFAVALNGELQVRIIPRSEA